MSKFRIDYIICTPDGISEQHTIFHPRTLTLQGLKIVLKRLGKERNSQHIERIVGQWKIDTEEEHRRLFDLGYWEEGDDSITF